MSMQINIGDHTSPEAGYIAFPNRLRDTIRWARRRARWIARNLPAADVYYRTLPNGNSLRQLLEDRSIWVNYHATNDWNGEISDDNKEIAIANQAFRIGRWTVLATLVHELAHANGAAGEPSKAAERAVLACGLGRQSEQDTGRDDPRTPYDPLMAG